MIDHLGDAMKALEGAETSRTFHPDFPLYARLDGRSFSSFTKKMKRPFDDDFRYCMAETTKALMEEFHADIGYCQSDEISLGWRANPEGHMLFGGKVFKLTSSLAAYGSVVFNQHASAYWPDHVRTFIPTFDCRVCQMPEWSVVLDMLEWRIQDCKRNSKNTLAQCHFSHKALHRKSTGEVLSMLDGIGHSWRNLPDRHRVGQAWERKAMLVELSDEERERIPEDRRPDGPVMRTRIVEVEVNTGIWRKE